MRPAAGKKIAIVGWGVDTEDVVPWLLEQGALLTVYDQKDIESDWRKDSRITWRTGSNTWEGLADFDLIVRAPGVYRYKPELVAAEHAGVVITSKTQLFFEVCPGKIIGVTGTKGKGTTSMLIYTMLKEAGKSVHVGGNIGEPLFHALPSMNEDTWVVYEMSSFQLAGMTVSPHIAVVLMVTSEHLDWHKDTDEYVDAKSAITRWQMPEDVVVANKDYPRSVQIGELGLGKKIWVSRSEPGWVATTPIRLKGAHNIENVLAACEVAREVGVERDVMEKVLASFKGLPHRLEEVREVEGVTYFDDSFSTVPETTIAALRAFSEPKVVIIGGSDKGSDYELLGKELAESRSLKAVILIGTMADKIEQAILAAGGNVRMIKGKKTMKEIVEAARQEAVAGDVVILSPACASFDMFKNYKDRGDQFKAEVTRLDGLNTIGL